MGCCARLVSRFDEKGVIIRMSLEIRRRIRVREPVDGRNRLERGPLRDLLLEESSSACFPSLARAVWVWFILPRTSTLSVLSL